VVKFPRGGCALKVVSQNSLSIYLFHVIVLEALQKGYLGFKKSVTTINPIIEIPLNNGGYSTDLPSHYRIIKEVALSEKDTR